MSLLDDYQRVTRSRPCPICGKPDWCLEEHSSSGDPATVICNRVESGVTFGEAGYLHRLHGSYRSRTRSYSFKPRYIAAATVPADLAARATEYVKALPSHRLQELEDGLGVTAESLTRLHVGWDGDAWTFPMRDSKGRVTGIRRRLLGGRKLSVKGGHEGLFIPHGVDPTQQLLVCEGPTDTAAVLDLGFEAIGRPSCSGGGRHIARYVRGHCPSSLVIVADRGEPGQRGAERLAVWVRALCKDVRVILPPEWAEDVREWVRGGASARDIQRAVDLAAPVGLLVDATRGRRA